MTDRIRKIALATTILLGATVGYRLAEIPHLQAHKLANIVGQLLNLLAVFVLSEPLVSSQRWKRICVEWVAPVFLWSTVSVPIGIGLGASLASVLGRGNSVSVVIKFAILTFSYGTILGVVLDQLIVIPSIFSKDIEARWLYFGLVLLATGMLLQVASALSGL